jgi:hypothetical protein
MARMKLNSVSTLESEYRSLDRQIHRLERRGLLMSPPEREQATALKRLRVLAKDRLFELRRR